MNSEEDSQLDEKLRRFSNAPVMNSAGAATNKTNGDGKSRTLVATHSVESSQQVDCKVNVASRHTTPTRKRSSTRPTDVIDLTSPDAHVTNPVMTNGESQRKGSGSGKRKREEGKAPPAHDPASPPKNQRIKRSSIMEQQQIIDLTEGSPHVSPDDSKGEVHGRKRARHGTRVSTSSSGSPFSDRSETRPKQKDKEIIDLCDSPHPQCEKDSDPTNNKKKGIETYMKSASNEKTHPSQLSPTAKQGKRQDVDSHEDKKNAPTGKKELGKSRSTCKHLTLEITIHEWRYRQLLERDDIADTTSLTDENDTSGEMMHDKKQIESVACESNHSDQNEMAVNNESTTEVRNRSESISACNEQQLESNHSDENEMAVNDESTTEVRNRSQSISACNEQQLSDSPDHCDPDTTGFITADASASGQDPPLDSSPTGVGNCFSPGKQLDLSKRRDNFHIDASGERERRQLFHDNAGRDDVEQAQESHDNPRITYSEPIKDQLFNMLFGAAKSTRRKSEDDMELESVCSAFSIEDECNASTQEAGLSDSSFSDNDEEDSPSVVPKKKKRKKTLSPQGQTTHRRKKCMSIRDLAVIDASHPKHMHFVDHMSSTEYDCNGRPVWTFVVYDDDSTLYRFRADVAPSEVSGGGLGAFLTYLGSLHLNPDVENRNNRALSKREAHMPETMNSLEFVRGDGQLATLTLKGENLHGNNNNPYWLKSALVSPRSEGKGSPLTGVEAQDQLDDDDFEALNSRSSKNSNKIGYLDVLLDSDFSSGNSEFKIQHCSIFLGRYGPILREDRKSEDFFNCKSFIFSAAPADYCFGVDEKFCATGRPQIVDITDDSTGLPHENAKRSLPMYVNEVGHKLDRKQNVFSCDRDDRSIEYSFVLPDNMTLKTGDRIELLTNYFDGYERIRERHGYGLKNLYGGVSGDVDYSSYLERCVGERLRVFELLSKFSMATIDIMEQVNEFIREPIERLLEDFRASRNCNVFDGPQLMALRRIFWLQRIFENMLEKWNGKVGSNSPLLDARVPVIRQGQQLVCSMRCHDFVLKEALWDSHELKQGRISTLVVNEAVEEACFSLRGRLVQPFSDSIWCELACCLIRRSSHLVVQHLWPIQQHSTEREIVSAQKVLLDQFIDTAEEFSSKIKQAVSTGDLSGLSFGSGFRQNMLLHYSIDPISESDMAMLLAEHTTTPKAYLSVIYELYLHKRNPCGESVADTKALNHTDRFFMAASPSVFKTAVEPVLNDFVGVPQSTSTCGPNEINTNWYILWQVLFVIHQFASIYCGEDKVLGTLCDRLNIPMDVAESAFSRGIKGTSQYFKIHCERECKLRLKRVLDLPRSVKVTNGNSDDLVSYSGNGRHRRGRRNVVVEKNKDDALVKQKSGTPRLGSRPQAIFLHEIIPDEPLEGGWPPGWTKKVYERASGKTKGDRDRYWYSPVNKYKFRSMVEVRKYLELLQKTSGDEDEAWAIFKNKKSLRVPPDQNRPLPQLENLNGMTFQFPITHGQSQRMEEIAVDSSTFSFPVTHGQSESMDYIQGPVTVDWPGLGDPLLR